jgi:quercetin dioxygenase-like cupin family protein
MKKRVESDVPSILVKDGVEINDLNSPNKEVINIEDILLDAPESSWSKRIIDTESNSATLICQNPGEGNREHYHHDWNEWWYIIDGLWEWQIEGETKIVGKGDIVFIEKGRLHKITAVGKEPAIRLAVSRSDVDHVYVE